MLRNNDNNNGHVKVEYKKCPFCNTPIFTAPRYEKVIKTMIQLFEHLKDKIRKAKEAERENAIDAFRIVSAEAQHWHRCPNGHFYAIGECGGAMQMGKCAECGVNIGGGNHTLLSGNSPIDANELLQTLTGNQ